MRLILILISVSAFGQAIHQITTTGQSLSIGTSGTPALSITQPFSNVYTGPSGSYVALTETGDPSNIESPGSGIANEITFLSAGNSYRVDLDKTGTGGDDYIVISKGYSGCPMLIPYNSGCVYNVTPFIISRSKAAAATAGVGYQFVATDITHGETDDNIGTTAAQYEADLVQLQNDFQTDGNAAAGQTAGTVIPMFVDQVSSWNILPGNAAPTFALGQWWAARDHPGLIYIVGPKYQCAYATDGLHLANTGYRDCIGQTTGKAMKTVLIDHGVWTGLVPRHLTISGATITAQLWVPGGVLTLDTTTVSDKGNCKGFEYIDSAGSTVGMSPFYTCPSPATASGDTVTIPLSPTPSGVTGQRLRYAYTGTPGTQSGQPNAAHGNIRDNDSTAGQSGATVYDWLITFDEPLPFSWDPSNIPTNNSSVGNFGGGGGVSDSHGIFH